MELPRGVKHQRTEIPPDAQWMESTKLAAYEYHKGSILLGKDGNTLIGSDDDRHLLTVAGSRAGKSSTCLKPNLFNWPSSVLCIDPKGELAQDTAKARHDMGQDVFILDPFGEVKGEAAQFRTAFNPLSEIGMGNPDTIVDDAALLADALIIPDKGGDSHWTNSAKNLLRGLVLYDLYTAPMTNDVAMLTTLRQLINAPLGDENTPDDGRLWLSTVFKMMAKHDKAYGGVVAGVGGTMEGKPKGEKGSIISTAVEQTSFLDSEPMQRHLSEPSRLKTLRQLKRKPTTIYLVLPASQMATHARWLRLILSLAMAALEREPMALPKFGKAPPSVLFILEEFPQLGYLRQIEAAAGLMAGYGVKLWTVLQDLSQLRAQYRDSWETFLGNAGVVQAFGNTDATTLEYLSKIFGTRTITEAQAVYNTPSASTSGGQQSRTSSHTFPLLAPFEVDLYGARDTGRQFIKFAGKPPAYIERLNHGEATRVY